MAIPVTAIVDAVTTAWDVFILAQTPPLHVGDTFTVAPYLYTAGTYDYASSAGITYADQPAYVSYADGNFSLTASGVGNFGITILSGNVTIGYYTPGSQAYTTFIVSDYPNNFFLVSGSSDYYTNPTVQKRMIGINRRAVSQSHNGFATNSDFFPAFELDGFGSTNIVGNNGASNIGNIVPLAPGSQVTYDQALNIYIDYWHTKYPDWTELDASDFPTEQDFIGIDPTEPTQTGTCCDIDYNEILSEQELATILETETYYLAEIPTDFVYDFAGLDIPNETLSPEYLSFFPAAINLSWDFFSRIGLTSVLVSVGIFLCLIRILRGR